MPSKQETGTSSLPESRLKSPSSGVFESLAPVPGDYRLSTPPYQTANKEKKNKK